MVALLPEDHTYAKGSLFILEPGTKCIVFDMDGEYFVDSFNASVGGGGGVKKGDT